MSTDSALLDRVDAYLDAVPRHDADAVEVGPFTLFRSHAPYPLYARPRRGAGATVTEADVRELGHRCAELGVPLAVEWVQEVSPEVAPAAAGAGLEVVSYPLLVLTADTFTPQASEGRVEVASSRDALAAARAVANVAFSNGGTAVGPVGTAERDAGRDALQPAHLDHFVRDADSGRAITVGLHLPGEGVVAAGVVKPVDGTAEIMGVATLPAFRRRGFGAAVTSRLVELAVAAGVSLVLLSADGDDVARVYERLGFRRIGHTGQAEAAR